MSATGGTTPTIRVLRGAPDDQELAAVLVALTGALAAEETGAPPGSSQPAVRAPFTPVGAWGRGVRTW